ncbi:glycosyltransferase [Rudaea cellulosilytica]|uniref:glycosyltransferase n=1 Tax=Rudaea cellulosilytica TaxID=540746 RepID=UPI00036831C3|nr:glycosyltransferase [Rudaea cellulosilytica]
MSEHIAIFLPSLDGGGAERVMLALADRFVSRGLRCDLVIAIDKGQLLDCVPPGVRLIKLHKHKTLRAVFALARYLRCERPDALLATVFTANICALLAAMLALTDTRVVTCEASLTEFDMQSSKRWQTTANRLAAGLLYRRADEVIAISNGVRQSLLKNRLVAPSRVHVVHNPLPFFVSPSERIRAKIKPLVLACGRLEPQKDHATLLRAFANARKHLDARLVVLGEGSLLQALQFQTKELDIEDDVTFIGFIPDPQRYMLEASAFVHTARYEGFGIVLLEALACGCPIIATDCPGGVREVLADGKYGTLVPVGDDQALAAAIEQILTGKVQFPDAGDYLRQFDIDRVAEKYLSVLFPQTSNPI